MKATNCRRYTFDLGGETHKYADLRKYVCNECGGGIVHLMPWNEAEERSEDKVGCGRCGGEDIISESNYLRQIAEGWEVMAGLPEYLQDKLKG